MGELYERKEIQGYDGKYLISSSGDVIVSDRITKRLKKNGKPVIMHGGIITLNAHDNGNGYQYITLWKNGKRKNHYIHRLVAEAFIPNPDNLPEVNHIDHNKANNNVENLEWVTRGENVHWSVDLMRHPRNAKLSSVGLKYISMRNGKYRVSIHIKRLGYQYDKRFKTLDEAIAAREAYFSGKEYFAKL